MRLSTRLRASALLFLIASLLFHLPLKAVQIDGSDVACGGDCITYTLSDLAGGPYTWSVDGDVLNVPSANGESLMVCWSSTEVAGQINVVDAADGDTDVLVVSLSQTSEPQIITPPIPSCQFELLPFDACTESVSTVNTILIEVDGTIWGEYTVAANADEIVSGWEPSILIGVEANDFVDADSLVFSYVCDIVTPPSNGYAYSSWMTGTTTGGVYYEPDEGFCGSDYFEYEWCFESEFGIVYSEPIIASVCVSIPCDDGTNPTTDSLATSNCLQACPNAWATYSAFQQTDELFDWEVQGAVNSMANSDGSALEVEWGDIGGSVKLVSVNAEGCMDSTVVCVEILDEVQAAFNSVPAVVGGQIDICAGQTVEFFNESTNVSAVNWVFETGQESSDFDPTYTFDTPGAYEVWLYTDSDCMCTDSTSVLVEVSDFAFPTIDCVGTLCAGDEETYWAGASCSTNDWTVSSNGLITAGGGTGDDFVTVSWGNGPTGTVTLSTDGCLTASCPHPTTATIPIVDDQAEIQGPITACHGQTLAYSITTFEGSSFNWTSLDVYSEIISGQGTSTVLVKWTDYTWVSNPHQLVVAYEHCYLGCGGVDTIDVELLPSFFVQDVGLACEGEEVTLNAISDPFNWMPTPCDWSIEQPNGTMDSNFATGTETTNYTPTMPGYYKVTATVSDPDDYCRDTYTLSFEVAAAPEAISTIDGPTEICPGQAYTYFAEANNVVGELVWEVVDGTDTTQHTGGALSYTWGLSGPYELSVSQSLMEEPFCESSPTSLSVSAWGSVALSGTEELCKEEEGSYTADITGESDFEWTITPANAGTLQPPLNTADMNVQWHEAGTHTISVSYCDLSTDMEVVVHDLPDPFVDDYETCPGIPAFVSTPTPYDNYTWTDESGTVVSTDPAPILYPGYYSLSVSTPEGCTANTPFQVKGFPVSEITISSSDLVGYCPPGSATLHTLENETPFVNYQWYVNGTAVGTNSATHEADVFGTYNVVVTDQNGCQINSNFLNVFEYCGDWMCAACENCPFPPQPCIPDGEVSFDWASTGDCNTIQFTNTSPNYVPGTVQYYLNDITQFTLENVVTADDYTHTYTEAGYYWVAMIGGVPNLVGDDYCITEFVDKVVVPIAADFTADTVCVGQATKFTDLSTFLAEEGEITDWAWTFGDPTAVSNTSTDQSPSHTFTTAGDFTVELVITDVSGCTSSIEKNIMVRELPLSTITAPTEACEGMAVAFTMSNTAALQDWEWDFDDPLSGTLNTATAPTAWHSFDVPGIYDVLLSVVDIYGCSETITHTIEVFPNALALDPIDFSIPSPICVGDTTYLTAPTGVSYLWNTGATTATIPAWYEGFYSVTVTDAYGCTYESEEAVVEVNDLPIADITLLEMAASSFNAVDVFHNGPYEACEGTSISLKTLYSATYSYSWSLAPGNYNQIYYHPFFGSDNLETGTYEFYLTVTDNTTGCEKEDGPFEVIIHPLPDSFMISDSPSGTHCEGEEVTLSVSSPQADLTYIWSNGTIGTSITVQTAGNYACIAYNEFGCWTNSQTITVHPLPDMSVVPNGCHEACVGDEICVPPITNAVSYQWYIDEVPMAAPNGNQADLIVEGAGVYTLEATDANGCSAISEPLDIQLLVGEGHVTGFVFFDDNSNGVYDTGETLLENVDVDLLDVSSTWIDETLTNVAGTYLFEQIPVDDYQVQLNTSTLPTGAFLTGPDIQPVSLVACNDTSFAHFPVQPCVNATYPVNLQSCAGAPIYFDGLLMSPGTTDVPYVAVAGCDSIVQVTVEVVDAYSTDHEMFACTGSTVNYESTDLSIGDVQDFTFVSALGCDSVVTVTVLESPSPTPLLTSSTSEWRAEH